MALTPQIRVSKAAVTAVVASDIDIRVSQARAVAIANYPAAQIRASKANVAAVVKTAVDLRVAKGNGVAVVLRKGENPYSLAWTATLDGHEYYYLQLYNETLVYDLLTERWYNWASESANLWRAQVGIDWNANVSSLTFGVGGSDTSSILVGDYQYGALYFLDPEMLEDDDYEGTAGVAFRRQIYGQLHVPGYNFVPVPAVQLRGSIGEDTATDMTVTLFYSDDEGETFVDCDALTLVAGEFDTRVEWRSLGSFRGQGRLFKIEDFGAITRIDGLDMPDRN